MTSMTDPDPKPKGTLSLQTLAMPKDANANGDIFGGWLMAQQRGSCTSGSSHCQSPTALVRVVSLAGSSC